ncbi:hypothetical protein QCA50_006875 [Cerrena zonata]|uniref:Man(5)GlcNAc(2)-PP-dolichol translocation protein RFT1 n=1 Tax=Cerrena zonata TaxID=2478898 RepID=A0AAW0GJZ1_9APHY
MNYFSSLSTKTQYFDTPLFKLSAAMTVQSVVKHFLTEGDKFVVSQLSPLSDQGGYAIASNYGSLVARIIFQPIEETSRVFFSKALSTTSDIPKEALESAANILVTILQMFTHLLLLLGTFGPPYLPLALSIVLPHRYLATSAPAILKVYVLYIPMMAFNGILEAFFASTATPDDLRKQSRWLLIFSVCFVGASVVFSQYLGLGDAGLVWANIVNLALRASYAWIFAQNFFTRRNAGQLVSLRGIAPPLPVSICFALCAIVTRCSYTWYHDRPLTIRGQLPHLVVGVGCVIGCLLACIIFERKRFQQIRVVFRRK